MAGGHPQTEVSQAQGRRFYSSLAKEGISNSGQVPGTSHWALQLGPARLWGLQPSLTPVTSAMDSKQLQAGFHKAVCFCILQPSAELLVPTHLLVDFLTFPKLWLGLVGLTQTPGGAAGVLQDLLLAIGSPEARMLFPWTWKAKRALYVPCSSSAGTRGPQASVLRPHTHRQYLVYKPFFRQKEFFTDSRRLLSSRAGKLLSSKLSISPWPRAPDLVLPPKDGVVGRIGTHQTTWPFLSSSILSLSLDAPFSCLLASRPRLEPEVGWRNS